MEINIYKYLTVKRLINAGKIFLSFTVSRVIRRPVVWGMPASYSIEPTNYCNLKCPECPSGLGELTRPLGLLKTEDFKKLINQIKDTGFYVNLYFQGEPYINKNLPQMIKYARASNIYIAVSTNGLLFKEGNVDLLLEDAPDKLIFSIDGLDEETYQNYRVGGTFKNADAGLRTLINKRNQLKRKLPFVELQFIVMKQNENQIEKLFKYGKETGVDKVTLKTMQVSNYENAVKFLPVNPKYSRYIVEDNNIRIKNKLKNHCFALWRTSVITWNGNVVPCCFDKDAEFKLGFLNNDKFSNIWRSKEYMQFRRGVLDNRQALDMCKNCTEGLKVNIREIKNKLF